MYYYHFHVPGSFLMYAMERQAASGESRFRYRPRGAPMFLWLALILGPPGCAGLSPAADKGLTPPAATDVREQRVTKRVVSGDTLPRLLTDLKVSAPTRNRWLKAVAKQAGVANVLKAGDTVSFHFIAPWGVSGPGHLSALRIERPGSKPLTWQLRKDHIVHHKDPELWPMVSVGTAPAAGSGGQKPVAGKTLARRMAKAPAEALTRAAPALVKVTHVLREGESLSLVLHVRGVAGTAAKPWIEAVGKRYPLRRLYPGRKIVLFFLPVSGGGDRGTLRALQVESRAGDLLTWQWSGGTVVYRGRNHRVVLDESAAVPGSVPARTPDGTPPTPSVEPLEKVIHTVATGQTLGGILRPLGVAGKEGEAWFAAIDKQYPVTRLKTGQRLHLYFEEAPARHRRDNLRAVQFEVAKGRSLNWERVRGKVRFRGRGAAGRGRAAGQGAAARSNGASRVSDDSFLSEYALARIRQRNGLLEYTPPPYSSTNGKRPGPSLESAERVTHRLKSGEHLWGVLRKYELNERERHRWLAALIPHDYVRRLQAGSRIHFFFERPANGAGNLKALEVVLRSDLRLTWYRNVEGIRFYKDEVPYQQEVRSLSGVITAGSLYDNARSAGVDPAVISRMVDVFAWDIDFQSDLRPGDTYRVLYRRKFRPGSRASDQIRILAAEFVNRGRMYTAVYFESDDGEGHYYNAQGRSVSRSFLRYPVDFRRISSRFSRSRFHPVLRVRRPHYGVDFAARTGTPVRAVGDGRIIGVGWKGGYGRLVEISHGSAMETRYAHLSRYGPGVRRGVFVKKGQTIGYVGCSGLCTGPHLHFEIWQDNRYVDPLRAHIPVERQLAPLLMNLFEDTRKLFFKRLEADGKAAAPS